MTLPSHSSGDGLRGSARLNSRVMGSSTARRAVSAGATRLHAFDKGFSFFLSPETVLTQPKTLESSTQYVLIPFSVNTMTHPKKIVHKLQTSETKNVTCVWGYLVDVLTLIKLHIFASLKTCIMLIIHMIL